VSDDNDKNVEPVDWAQKSAEAMNRHTTSPEFTARYKKGLEEDERRETLTEVRKKDLEVIRAEEAAAKQAEAKR
jgi:hypothetical protein